MLPGLVRDQLNDAAQLYVPVVILVAPIGGAFSSMESAVVDLSASFFQFVQVSK